MKCVHTFTGHDGFISSIAVNEPNLLLTASHDMKIKKWDFNTMQELGEYTGHQKPIQVVQILKNSGLFASGGKDKTLKLWSISSTDCIKTLNAGDEVNSIVMKNNLLFAGLTSGLIKIWDLTNFKLVKTLNYHKGSVFALHLTPRYLFSGSRDHSINVFNLDTLEFMKKIDPPHYDGVNTFCSLSDTLLLSASRDKVIKLWNTANDDIVQDKIINNAHQDWINCLCKHEQTVYSGCRDGTIAAWNAESLNQISTIQAHISSINAMASASKFLFTASNDRTIKMWKESDQPISVIPQPIVSPALEDDKR